MPGDAVRLIYQQGEQGRSTAGYYPRNERGRHYVYFDPEAAGARVSYGAITNEFGHVLGLKHEHQRYDARDKIVFHYDQLQGHDDGKDEFRESRLDEESDLSSDQIDSEWVTLIESGEAGFFGDWQVDQILPFKKDYVSGGGTL
ncbi:hypothetical protein EJ08DRAFT_649759 [Tothia fuscella]|uniref:Peptidase M12A domain-containing protein n=1 Tax=Tothia fuscella TaxID=1048955 RepID=A0A9P4NRS2_9PEZI|nr:hypothetical protein EJ08DRAFT_649759 [Tothia fuscella]